METNKQATENGDDEDFEILSESPNAEDTRRAAADTPAPMIAQLDESVDATTGDPYKTFEFIHKEHFALKEELLVQQQMLSHQLKFLEAQKTTGDQKIGELNDRINFLLDEVGEKDRRLINTEQQMKSYKDASEKTDEVCAKMLMTEERLKYYEDVVNRMSLEEGPRTQGASAASIFSSDACLAKEILENDNRLQTLLAEMLEKESSRLCLSEENLKLKEENKNLSNLITALQAQVEADQADIEDMKCTYERRISCLTADLNSFVRKKSVSSAENSSESCSTLRQNVPILTLNDSHGRMQIFECERCKLRLPTAEIFQKHAIRCPSMVDSVF